MSYTVEYVNLPEEYLDARERAHACDDDECGHTPDCYEEYWQLREDYTMDLNGHSMGRVLELMRQFGMVYESVRAKYRGPRYTPEQEIALGTDEAIEYERFLHEHQSQRSEGIPGFPAFKFQDNGPWFISIDEIRDALGAYESQPSSARQSAEEHEPWRSWIEWLNRSLTHGGFRVT